MTTVAEIVDASLMNLVVAGAEASVDAVDASQYIFKLNNHMNTLIGGGVTITWTPVTNLASDITIYDQAETPVDISQYCIQYLEHKMAELMAPQYGVQLTAEQYRAMKAGRKSLLKKSRLKSHQKYPRTLPVGSGNEYGSYANDHFYDGTQSGEIDT